METEQAQYLVDPEWLRAHRNDSNLVLIDTRRLRRLLDRTSGGRAAFRSISVPS